MNRILTIGAVSGFLAVALGAFGAHALKELLGERITVYETANRYHFYHTFAIFISALLYSTFHKKSFLTSCYLFAAGTLIFSGSLYALSISGVRILGAITPIGGVLLLAGWATLGYSVIRLK
jgi:uncharacterized membrane protein YgdD (TMEM256/DUF423 family)